MTKKREKKEKRRPGDGGKRPAHEVITHQIRVWFNSKTITADTAIAALGKVLNGMIIPKDEIPKVKDRLMDILTCTPASKCSSDNLEALQEVIQSFKKEHPE